MIQPPEKRRGRWPLLACVLLLTSFECWAALTQAERDSVLAAHNQVRATVSPPAANMTRLVWDPNLATVAQNWTNQCNWAHNGGRNAAYASLSSNSGGVGENIFITTGSRASALTGPGSATPSWASEVVNYNFAANTCASGQVCGHYTQIVWANTLRIGCGITQCATVTGLPPTFNNGQFVTCNYNPAGNFIGQRPYVAGATGSQCPPALPELNGGLCSPASIPVASVVPSLPAWGLVALGCVLVTIGMRRIAVVNAKRIGMRS